MTQDDFRSIALSMPEASENAHMGHPDFRVRGKIFATVGYPNEDSGMVKLTIEQQHEFVQAEPGIYEPVPGGWGEKGCTRVRLAAANEVTLHNALFAAWREAAKPQKRAKAKRAKAKRVKAKPVKKTAAKKKQPRAKANPVKKTAAKRKQVKRKQAKRA